MRAFKVGRHLIPLWLIIVLLISGIGSGVLGYYVWRALIIPLEIKEPLELLNYPSQLSLYAGDFKEFNITIQNHSLNNYSVILDFSLSNLTYQTSYVTFSNEIYTVSPGQQNLTASLDVKSDAPPLTTSLTINFMRGIYPSGLVGYWKFDEGSGTVTLDSSKNDKYGIIHGAIWVSGKYRHALKFDGVDDYVEIPVLFSSSPSSLTVSAWINSTLSKMGYIVYHGDNGEFVLQTGKWEGDTTVAGMEVKLDGSSYFVYSAPMTPNVWHHIVGVWTKGVSLKIYVDGELAGENTTIPDRYLTDWGPIVLPSIGDYNRDIQPLRSFDGTIDEVRVYNRALSAEEVQALYTSPPF